MSYQEPTGQTPEQRLEAARAWAGQGGGTVEANLAGEAAEVTTRLQTVLAAAERAAEAIRYDAEDHARRYLADAQRRADQLTAERVQVISELTDDLIENATIVREHSEKMVGALEQALSIVTGQLSEIGAGGVASPTSEPPATGSQPPAAGPSEPGSGRPQPSSTSREASR